MLKDQLLAFALLFPFLTAPVAGGTATNRDKPGTEKPAVSAPTKTEVRTPVKEEKKTTTAPTDTKTPVKDPKTETKTPLKEDKKAEVKTPVTEEKKTDAKTPPQSLIGIPFLPPYQEITAGTGAKLAPAERAVIHFIVADSSGKELLNSKKRGLTLTVEPKPEGAQVWDILLKDMKVGGVRKMTLMPDEVNGGRGLPPYIPGGIQIQVTVWLLRSVKA